jgi:uncharacterized protein
MTKTTFPLRDLGISPGQSRHEELMLELVPYVQGGVDYVDAGGKAPVLGPKQPKAPTIEYGVAGDTVPAQLDITAMDDGESFRLRFSATFSGPCARCLEDATWSVDVDVHAVHDPDTDDEALRMDHIDDDTHVLDVSSWAREEIGLRFPARLLCRKDCRGLCGECGVNLNEEPAHEHEKPQDSRWEALKGLQLDED